MDKNTIIGIVLIFLVIVGFSWLNKPSEQQLEQRRQYQDSVRTAQIAEQASKAQEEQVKNQIDNLSESNLPDSVKKAKMAEIGGGFAVSLSGKKESVVLENSKMRVELSTLGGYAEKVTLKEYKTYQKEPLDLFTAKDAKFDIELPLKNGKAVNTSKLYFTISEKTDSSLTLTAKAEEGYLSYHYTLPADSYLLQYSIRTNGLSNVVAGNKTVNLNWATKIRQKEKSAKFESRYAELSYKEYGDNDVEELTNTGDEEEEVKNDLHWVAFKDQFFSSVLIANGKNPMKGGKLESSADPDLQKDGLVQSYNTQLALNLNPAENATSQYTFFYGPNKYKLLKSYDKHLSGNDQLNLKRLIPLGWAVFRWVNQIICIPLFDFLGTFISNYGLLILLMTIIVKLVLAPMTYKSYLSTAKMRVLKPEIEKMTKDIPEENMAEKQQATMEVYSKAGVSPMGGCLPMLLQMPILIALFWFFPTAIELRGESFLWAEDLSAYDAVISWNAQIPLISWAFGNHISLFCLLMTITNVLYTKFNMQMTDTGASQQMPMMKYMMYLMPFFFFFIFNDYASGLTYYYFISLLITILMTLGMRFFIDEDKLLKKIKEKSAKKPASKSSWMQRIAEMQKQQQELMKQQKEKNQ